MGKNFSLRLALNNIKNHRKFYLPYFFASVGIIAMFYIICFLAMNPGISEMADSLVMIMGFGSIVMAIFSFVFLFYTNSFLMKRRKKEIGLYNILGMEKRHIGRILAIENTMIAAASLVAGLLCGVLFSKLVHLFLSWVFGTEPPFGVEVSGSAVWWSIVLFGVLFVLTTLNNQMSIRLAKPIELLYGGNVGEKEPKSRGILAVIGFVTLAAGYFIALTTESPLDAILLFFVAVVLVIIGTYCLFTAGSITILKALRKNRKFYYKPANFTAVSGMIYRMKQNAVGLANICILSTMVLVMVSGTVSLFFGTGDLVDTMAPGNINVKIQTFDGELLDEDKALELAAAEAEKQDLKIEKTLHYKYLPFVAVEKGNDFVYERGNADNMDAAAAFAVMTEDDYTRMTGEKLGLSKNEVAVNSKKGTLPEEFQLGQETFVKKAELDRFVEIAELSAAITDTHYLVVADQGVLNRIYQQQAEAYQENASGLYYLFAIDTDGDEAENKAFSEALDKAFLEESSQEGGALANSAMIMADTREDLEGPLMGFVGGFLFLGVFLGIVFTFAAALIIYYKQISEGYYDKDKFEIMQKVGMSKGEVRRTIRKQVLMVFFVPLLMAGLHILAAFKMITKLLLVFGMNNIALFAVCTLGTFLVFAVIYALVYLVTAREYYKIVG